MIGFSYWTKHFDGFDIAIEDSTGKSFIVSESDPDNKPQIGPFETPVQAISFGMNRVKEKR